MVLSNQVFWSSRSSLGSIDNFALVRLKFHVIPLLTESNLCSVKVWQKIRNVTRKENLRKVYRDPGDLYKTFLKRRPMQVITSNNPFSSYAFIFINIFYLFLFTCKILWPCYLYCIRKKIGWKIGVVNFTYNTL